MKNLYSSDAFTGLEAAIVLIAFVVVAAVFSYVVLGAGFFTSQTAQATVHTGVSQASSSMEVVGNVYGIGTTTASNLLYAKITIALTAGGTPIDLSKMVVSYTDTNGGHNANVLAEGKGGDYTTCTVTKQGDAGGAQDWCVEKIINGGGAIGTNPMLNPNAQIILDVGLPAATALRNGQFTINLQPSAGAALPITRTIPGSITSVQPVY